jgi:hypothetical protein
MTLDELSAQIAALQAQGLGEKYVCVEVNEDIPVFNDAILGIGYRGGNGVYISIDANNWGTEV